MQRKGREENVSAANAIFYKNIFGGEFTDRVEDIINDNVSSTKELWIPCTNSSNSLSAGYGDYAAGTAIAENNRCKVSFVIPHNFNSITEAVLVVIPEATGAAVDWDIYSDYSASGEGYQTHSESDEATTYNVTADQMYELDISGILSSIAAGDYVGIQLSIASGESKGCYVLGVRFKYT